MEQQVSEFAATAARLIVDEGLEYGNAKQQAARQLGLGSRTPWPDNDEVEQAVREHIALFASDTQPVELAALRALALRWMERLAAFRPHLSGAAWRGTATKRSDLYVYLYCDDSKAAELSLIDQGLRYQAGSIQGKNGQALDTLSLSVWSEELNEHVGLHLLVVDHDDLRGALKPDRQGRSLRGSLESLRRLVHDAAP